MDFIDGRNSEKGDDEMKKKITITLTRAEANAVTTGLESALQFWDTYFMFAPGEDLSHGNHSLDEKRRELAYGVIARILGEMEV